MQLNGTGLSCFQTSTSVTAGKMTDVGTGTEKNICWDFTGANKQDLPPGFCGFPPRCSSGGGAGLLTWPGLGVTLEKYSSARPCQGEESDPHQRGGLGFDRCRLMTYQHFGTEAAFKVKSTQM